MHPTIVLVDDGCATASSWREVYALLRDEGFTVRIVDHTADSLADDVSATRRVVESAAGPVVLVGHSYGGAVITEAGNDRKVAALVYVAAIVPDKGESVAWLLSDPTSSAPCSLPLATGALHGKINEPAWRRKPSWYLVAADDRVIPARAQWAMAHRASAAITETGGCHALPPTEPAVVAAFIADAARAVMDVAQCA
jgi:pimeloyl-ACP methyl ester carboxylesterase